MAAAAAAAAASSGKALAEGLCCFLCHALFTEPVSIDCGHSFCRACIAQQWGEREDADFSCPQCGERALKRKFWPNKELENVAEIAKRMKLEKAAAGESECEMHPQQPLSLFCKDEQKLLCSACTTESKDHASHVVVTAEEAAQDLKEELKIQLQAWREKREKTLSFCKEEENKYKEFLAKVNAEKQRIISTFEEVHHFLKQQEKSVLSHLEELAKEEEEFVTKLSGEIWLMDTFIHEMEEKSWQPANAFLQNIGETLNRCKVWKFQQPKVCSELEKKLYAFSKKFIILQNTMRAFTEDLPQQMEVEWENVTLDPETAHPILTVSDDQKNLTLSKKPRNLTDNPERFNNSFCVLGCEGFISGRHYWEVKVGERGNWAVGVARESVKRKECMSIRHLQEGIWAVSKKQNGGLVAGSLALKWDVPMTIGVYLDYGLHRVTVVDADKGNALCTYSPASFKAEKIYPFFWLQRPYGSHKGCWLQLSS
ncbi:zinc finger protein RFP-like [Hemicordylus capensis]|uniref:zinc finger protein RFP-like n=1 Tax=Hemicordylus capensis TaxID=884348 RepID=UPI002304205A|nr:zinc finger protein RFP-like [Hemicordylus capensis]